MAEIIDSGAQLKLVGDTRFHDIEYFSKTNMVVYGKDNLLFIKADINSGNAIVFQESREIITLPVHTDLENLVDIVQGYIDNVRTNITTVTTTPYTLSLDELTILVDDDAVGGPVTINLPPAVNSFGKVYTIKKLGTTGNVTIDADGAETIDGELTHILQRQYDAEKIICDGIGWFKLSKISPKNPTYKSYSLSNPGNSGTFYVGGHYGFSATDATLTIGGVVTRTFGAVGECHASHAFIVASGAGGADLVLTVSGISIDDMGVKNLADTEIIVPDTDAAVLNQYFETSKKWLGQIVFTLTGAAGAFTFNYGFAKYEDFGNQDFEVTDFEATGEARANETGLNIELLYHEATAFLYNAGAFVPNQTALVSLAVDHGTDGNDVANGFGFAYKRTGLSQVVGGNDDEGLMIRVTTVVNNSINDATFHIGIIEP